LIIDPACSIIFENEREEKNVMLRPPKKMDEPFFGIRKILLSCTQGLGILLIVLLIYFIGLKNGYSEASVRTFSFVSLIASNIAVILSNRSWHSHIFQILATPNKAVIWVVGGAVLFLGLVLNVPFLIKLFLFEKISIFQALICFLMGFSSMIWFEVYKQIKPSR
jgi:Ca2+-transporting ATPase